MMSADAPDMSATNAAAANTSRLAGRLETIGDQQMAQGQALIDRYSPIYDQILGQQQQQAGVAQGRADEQWDRYTSIFAPVADQFAADAKNYDSASRLAEETGAAAGTVQAQADAAREQNSRTMAAMRVSPSSGRSMQSGIDMANATALGKAGAINTTRKAIKDTGIQLRGQAAQIGNQVAGLSAMQSGIASANRSGAMSTINDRINLNTSAMAPAMSAYGNAAGQYGQAGALGQSSANAAYGAAQNRANSTNQAVGAAVGTALMFLSDEGQKENIEPVEGEDTAMQAVREMPVSKWNYREGAGDGGTHIGPMAQDVQQAAGDEVAPGGEAIDLGSMSGIHTRALQELDRRLRRFEDLDTSMPMAGAAASLKNTENVRL